MLLQFFKIQFKQHENYLESLTKFVAHDVVENSIYAS
jgi:hypothetical protein